MLVPAPGQITRDPETNDAHIARPPKWKDELKNEFKLNIDPVKINEIHHLLNSQTPNIKPLLNDITSKLSDLFIKSSEKTFHYESNKLPCRTHIRPGNYHYTKPWFGPQCYKARNSYHYARKAYQIHKCDVNKRRLKKASVHYKQTINTYMSKHKYTAEKKLRSMSSTKPKDYWKFLNSLKTNNQTKYPPIETFFEYFKNANKSNDSDEPPPDADHNIIPNIETTESLNNQITCSEMEKAITKCKNGKSPSQHDRI